MTYKSIFTAVTQVAQTPQTISAAAKLCGQTDGHLDVLTLGVDRTQVGYSYIGSGAVVMQVAMERADADARSLEAAAKAAIAA